MKRLIHVCEMADNKGIQPFIMKSNERIKKIAICYYLLFVVCYLHVFFSVGTT